MRPARRGTYRDAARDHTDLKDVLWRELNSECNKLQSITAEDTLVHRDKDMSRFAAEMLAEGEDGAIEYVEEEDIEDLDDFEYELDDDDER